jgi:lichenan operon transcriptional antiterminator
MNHCDQILCYLGQDDIVTIDNLVEKLHLSERSIRDDIFTLRKDEKIGGFEIKTLRGRGYSLHVNNQILYQKYHKNIKSSEFYNKNERINKIKELMFMRHDGFITVDEMSSVLGVSRRTILSDLKTVRSDLKSYHLNLYSKSHYGIKVIGDEINIRSAISDILNKNGKHPESSMEYFEFEKNIDKNKLKTKYVDIIKNHKLSINDGSINAIILHSLIMIYRITHQNSIHEVHVNHSMISEEYFKVAEEMIKYIEQEYKIKIQKQEVELMASQLFGKCEYIGTMNEDNADLKDSIIKTLKVMDTEYGTDFSTDNLLIEGLLLHVYPLRLRAASGLELNNSLVGSVSAQYMNAFIMSMRFIENNSILNKYSFSRDEIGYIAFHFATHEERKMQLILENVKKIALIIDSVRSDVSLLKLKINQVFPNAQIRVVENSDTTPEGIAESDLAITTIKNANGILKTAIYVQQFVDEHVLWMLRNQALYYIQSKSEKMPELTGLFNEDLFFIESEKITYKTALIKYSNIICERGYATNEYSKSVLERENKFSTMTVSL